jgi:hypothetical protein
MGSPTSCYDANPENELLALRNITKQQRFVNPTKVKEKLWQETMTNVARVRS